MYAPLRIGVRARSLIHRWHWMDFLFVPVVIIALCTITHNGWWYATLFGGISLVFLQRRIIHKLRFPDTYPLDYTPVLYPVVILLVIMLGTALLFVTIDPLMPEPLLLPEPTPLAQWLARHEIIALTLTCLIVATIFGMGAWISWWCTRVIIPTRLCAYYLVYHPTQLALIERLTGRTMLQIDLTQPYRFGRTHRPHARGMGYKAIATDIAYHQGNVCMAFEHVTRPHALETITPPYASINHMVLLYDLSRERHVEYIMRQHNSA